MSSENNKDQQKKICIFSAATENYMYRLKVLYCSLRNLHTNIYFDAYLINIEKEKFFSKLNDDKLNIHHITLKKEDDNKIKEFAANIRAHIFPILLEKYYKLFWCDADTIIRKPIDKLLNILDNNDLALCFGKNGSYKTGIIGIKKNNEMFNFVKEWCKNIFDNKIQDFYWGQDQETITYLIKLSKYKIKIYHLSRKFMDWKFFSPTSLTWVGKGNRKNLKKYTNEEIRILNKYKKQYNI